MFFQTKKGQAGSVFKLLIGAVIGLAIVGIIYSIIIVMSNQKSYLSDEVFSNKIKMAMKNPTGQDYLINDFSFSESKVLSKKSLSEQTGLGTNCITLNKGNGAPNITYTDDYFSFPKNTIVDLIVNCDVGTDSLCQIVCHLTVYDRSYKN